VVVSDLNDERLALAARMGATRTVNVMRERLTDVQAALGMTEGFDVGLEMSGSEAGFAALVENMCHGGKIAILGLPSGDVRIDWHKVIFSMLTLKGVYGREIFETWYKMQVFIQSGLDLSPIISHRLPADEFRRGFDAMLSGEASKVVLNWE
jgi:threonine 3-dehydrogenase